MKVQLFTLYWVDNVEPDEAVICRIIENSCVTIGEIFFLLYPPPARYILIEGLELQRWVMWHSVRWTLLAFDPTLSDSPLHQLGASRGHGHCLSQRYKKKQLLVSLSKRFTVPAREWPRKWAASNKQASATGCPLTEKQCFYSKSSPLHPHASTSRIGPISKRL